MIPEARHWGRIRHDGESRTVRGRTLHGTKNYDASPYYLLRQGYEEWLDEGDYTYGWAMEKLGPGPNGEERIFVSGPLAAKTEGEVEDNIIRASGAYHRLWNMGHWPYCPHRGVTPDRVFYQTRDEYERCLELSVAWLTVCHSILMLEGWEGSEGARYEHEVAERLKLKVYYSFDEVPEITRPGLRPPNVE